MDKSKIWKLILDRRKYQDEEWKDSSSNSHFVWFIILSEEVGEVAKAILKRNIDEMLYEIIDVLAVAVSWLEYKFN